MNPVDFIIWTAIVCIAGDYVRLRLQKYRREERNHAMFKEVAQTLVAIREKDRALGDALRALRSPRNPEGSPGRKHSPGELLNFP